MTDHPGLAASGALRIDWTAAGQVEGPAFGVPLDGPGWPEQAVPIEGRWVAWHCLTCWRPMPPRSPWYVLDCEDCRRGD